MTDITKVIKTSDGANKGSTARLSEVKGSTKVTKILGTWSAKHEFILPEHGFGEPGSVSNHAERLTFSDLSLTSCLG